MIEWILLSIFIVVALLACVGFTLGVITMARGSGATIQRQIVLKDDLVDIDENGYLVAKGFTNDAHRTDDVGVRVTEHSIQAPRVSDGFSEMSQGSMSVPNDVEVGKQIRCESLTDGVAVIEEGSLTTTGHIAGRTIVATQSIESPARGFASVHILPLRPINFSGPRTWQDVAATTSNSQLFLPSDKTLSHGVGCVPKETAFYMHKAGIWQYHWEGLAHVGSANAILGFVVHSGGASSLGKTLPAGFAVAGGHTSAHISAGGFVRVDNPETDLFHLYARHEVECHHYDISIERAALTLRWIGT